MSRKQVVPLCILLAVLAWCGKGWGQSLTVAAAADLQFALREIAGRFQKDTGKQVRVTFGSSGNFYAQIQNGAPFDVFFSADFEYPRQLEAAGLTEPGTLCEYAVGKIVIWTLKESSLDLSRGLAVVGDAAVQRIAIANPEHAPYGRAAVSALQYEKLYDLARGKFVVGENVSQVAAFVASGNADLGIIALSLASAPSLKERGKYVEIPREEYPAMRQAAIVLKSSKQKATAKQFLDYVKSAAIVALLKTYGFSPGPAGSQQTP